MNHPLHDTILHSTTLHRGVASALFCVLVAFALYTCTVDNSDKRSIIKEGTPEYAIADSLADYWSRCGVAMSQSGNYDSAKVCFTKATELYHDLGNMERYITMHINLGDAYYMTGQLALASRSFHHGWFLCDSTGLKDCLIAFNTGLARVNIELEKYEEAHRYFDLAARDVDSAITLDRYLYYSSLGNCLFFEDRYEESKACFIECQKILDSVGGDSLTQVQIDTNLGEIYLMQDSLEKAFSYLSKAYQSTHTALPISPSDRYYILSLIMTYYGRHDNYAAIKAIDAEMPPESDVQVPRYKAANNSRAYDYYKTKGDYKTADGYLNLKHQWEDSVRNLRARYAAEERQLQFERDTTILHNQILLEKANAEVRQHRLIITLIVIAGIFIIVNAIWIYRRNRVRNRIILDAQLKEINRLKMDVVRNRVQPHYLFNVLGATLPKLEKYPEAREPLHALIDTIRDSLMICDKTAITLERELDNVRNMIALHKHVSTNKPEVVWDIKQGVPMDTLVPSTFVQIVVENAMKHAWNAQCTVSPKLTIAVSYENNAINITVQDNGSGYNPGTACCTERGTGTGMKIICRTIELLNQKNTQKMSFKIHNLSVPEHGTRVIFIIPRGYKYE